jgi:hypothetical protein
MPGHASSNKHGHGGIIVQRFMWLGFTAAKDWRIGADDAKELALKGVSWSFLCTYCVKSFPCHELLFLLMWLMF